MRGALGAVAGALALAGTVAFAAPLFEERVLVATSDAIEEYSMALDELGELPVADAAATTAAPDGSTWVLSGSRLLSFAASGASLSDTSLPVDADDSGKHIALAALLDGSIAVAVNSSLFLVSPAGDVTAELGLPSDAVAAGVHGTRLWVAHESGIAAFEGGASVANIGLTPAKVRDLSVAPNGELWIALGSQLRVLSATGAVLRSRVIAADRVSVSASGAWIASGSALTRLDDALQTISTAASFPKPSAIVSIATDPRDGSVIAAAMKRVRHVGPAGELLADRAFDGNARVKAQHAVTLRVDRVAPSLVFLSPLPGSCTSDVRVPLVVAFSDLGAGPDPGSLSFFTPQGPLAVTCAFLAGEASCTPNSDFPQGSITVSATIADLASIPNVSLAATTTFDVDATAPQAVVDPFPTLTNVASQTLSGTLSEAASLEINGAPVSVSPDLAFSFPVQLVEGTNAFEFVLRDCANETRFSISITLDTVPPPAVEAGLVFISESVGGLVDVRGEPSSSEPGTTVTVRNERTGDVATAQVRADGSWEILGFPAESADPISVFLQDAAGNTGETTGFSVPGTPGEEPAPDPALIASPIDRSLAATPFADSVRFLWEHATTPVQTGVAPGALDDARRLVVLRGRSLTREGAPLAGVRVHAVGHPEWGETRTRIGNGVGGRFDFAALGGTPGSMVLRYERAGFLTVERRVENLDWNDIHVVPDVVMTPLDSAVSQIDFSGGASQMQVHVASAATDFRGARAATLLVPSGTLGQVVRADGSLEPLLTAGVRATEVTVGDEITGPLAMTALLPPYSMFTYMLGYGVDGAQDAREIVFSQPLVALVPNFLALSTGVVLPVGFYSRPDGQWIAEENGRVIEVASVTGGLADLIVDEGGTVASEADYLALGITEEERAAIASLHGISQTTLWRYRVPHFSDYDVNMAGRTPPGAKPEGGGQDPKNPDGCTGAGSIVDCQSQVLRESAPVQGAPFSLGYTSTRASGRVHERTVEIEVTDTEVHPELEAVRVFVGVAGQEHRFVFPPLPNQRFKFSWDQKDAYGRTLQGVVPLSLRTEAIYPVSYTQSPDGPRVFGQPGTSLVIGSSSFPKTGFARSAVFHVGVPDARGIGLGGWTLSAHHQLDFPSGRLYLGTGERRDAAARETVADTVIGGGTLGPLEGREATFVHLLGALDVAVDAPGNVYVLEKRRVFRASPDGTLVRVAGPSGDSAGFNPPNGFFGDGGPARDALFEEPEGIAIGPDGSLYIADTGNHRVRRVGPDGIVRTIAGNGAAGFGGDGGPATSASFRFPVAVAVGFDGSIFVADRDNNRVRRIGPDGRISTFAGNGTALFPGSEADIGNGVPAVDAQVNTPTGVAVATDGSVYIAARNNWRIRRVDAGGIITTVAGRQQGSMRCNGCPATDSSLVFPLKVAVAPDGSVFFTEPRVDAFDPAGSHRLRQILPDGIVVTLNESPDACGDPLDDRPVAAACMRGALGAVAAPDGSLYLAQDHAGLAVVRRFEPAFGAGFAATPTVLLPSAGGGDVYVFDQEGRHLATRDTLTGETRFSFAYAPDGRLASVTDLSGNVTTISRPAPDTVVIDAPGGQRSTLSIDTEGFLGGLSNDAGETRRYSIRPDGLLSSQEDPRGNASHYTFEGEGRLTRTDDAAGGFGTYAREAEIFGELRVRRRTAEGRETLHDIAFPAKQTEIRTNAFPDGTAASEFRFVDESREVIRPDGMRYRTFLAPDPRFGMPAAFTSRNEVRTPDGLSFASTRTQSVTLDAPTDRLSVRTRTIATSVNGKTWTSSFSAGPPRTMTSTSPEGRVATSQLDHKGRVVRTQSATLAAVNLVYRPDGLLDSTTQGEFPDGRTVSMTYDARRELTSVTDPLGRTSSFERDFAGRVVRQVLPDGREILTRYDASGNVTGVTPPSRPEHRFGYTEVDLEETYDPPDVAGATPGITNYEYDLDRRLRLAIRPDGATVELTYGAAGGKLSEFAHAAATVSNSYDPSTGQLVAMSESGGTSLLYEYDGSLVLSESMFGPVAGQVSRAYDSDFRVREERINGVDPIAVVYDDDSLPIQVGDLLLSRNPATGLLDGTTLGSVATARTTNAFAEPIAESAQVGSVEVIGFEYDRDALGRITELRESISGIETPRALTYDSAGRLTDVRVGGFDIAHWAYDGNSNRISATTLLGTVMAEYDEQDRLLRSGDAIFTYSANGELATRTDPSGTTSYTYDALGNLRRVELADGRVIAYLIDARNRRVGKEIDGVLVQGWLYRDKLEPVAELDGAGSVVSRFVYATKSHTPDYMVRDGRTYRIVSDHLGSPRMVIDVDTGAVVQRMDFDEWGVVTLDTKPAWQPFGFAGGLWDADTSLTRFGARDYSAAEGRWTAKDAVFTGSAYEYCWNDPVNLVDRSGLSAAEVWELAEEAIKQVPPPVRAPLLPIVCSFAGGLVAGAIVDWLIIDPIVWGPNGIVYGPNQPGQGPAPGEAAPVPAPEPSETPPSSRCHIVCTDDTDGSVLEETDVYADDCQQAARDHEPLWRSSYPNVKCSGISVVQ